jgi:hypothetical protein
MSRSRDNHTGSTRIMWERNGHGILETAFESNTISAKMAFFHSISVFDSHFLSFICLFDRLLKIILTKILEFNRLLLSSFFFLFIFWGRICCDSGRFSIKQMSNTAHRRPYFLFTSYFTCSSPRTVFFFFFF